MGANNSSPSTFRVNDEKVNDKDPLVSNLDRRRKRRFGLIEDLSSGKIYKKMRETPQILPGHLQQCLDWHKTKPWLEKNVKYNLVAYPIVGKNPPEEEKVFFLPIISLNIKEKREIQQKGEGYNWFIPSKFLWSAHCFVQHQKDSRIVCDSQNLIRTLTDEGGNSQSFIFGVIFDDETFKILDRSDYEKECKWWERNSGNYGGYGEKSMFLKSANIYSKAGDMARNLMKKKIASIFTEIGKPTKDTDNFIIEVDNEFINTMKSYGKNTIFDYVSHCLGILIFIKPTSPLYKYTTAFRTRLLNGYYKVSSIPLLETFDMFPDFYASSRSSNDIDNVKSWIKKYLDEEIEGFFNTLSVYLDPTARKYTRPRSDVFDLSVDLQPKPIREQCPDMDDTPEEDIILYKDPYDKLFCFTVDQLLYLEDDTNPLDTEGPKLSPEFLYKFKRNFKDIKKDLKKKDKKKVNENKCTQCKNFIDEYVLRTGTLVESSEDLKSRVQDFCSVECLEKYKTLEELFGKEDEELEIELEDKLKKDFEIEKRDMEETCNIKVGELTEKYRSLQEKIDDTERKIIILNSEKELVETQKKSLDESIIEKEKNLNEKTILLDELKKQITEKTGVDITDYTIQEVMNLIDKKDSDKDKKAAEYGNLINEINLDKKVIKKDNEEIVSLKRIISENKKSIVLNKALLDRSTKVQEDYQVEINTLKEKHKKELIEKNKEAQVKIAKRDVEIKSLQVEIERLKEEESQENKREIADKQASIDDMKNRIEVEKKTLQTQLDDLQDKYNNLLDEKKSIEKVVEEDNEIKNGFEKNISLLKKQINDLETQRNDLINKSAGIPLLESKIKSYEDSGDSDKLQKAQNELSILNAQCKQTVIFKEDIDRLKADLLKERAKTAFTNLRSTQNDKKINGLNSEITKLNEIIEENLKTISTLKSQTEKCDLNSNLTKEMEELKTLHKKEMEDMQSRTQSELAKQRTDILKEMDGKCKDIASSNSSSEEQIKEKINNAVNEAKEKIESEYEKKIKEEKGKLDILLEKANKRLEDLSKIKEKEITKKSELKEKDMMIKQKEELLEQKTKDIADKLEMISRLQREKEEWSKKCEEKGKDIGLAFTISDVGGKIKEDKIRIDKSFNKPSSSQNYIIEEKEVEEVEEVEEEVNPIVQESKEEIEAKIDQDEEDQKLMADLSGIQKAVDGLVKSEVKRIDKLSKENKNPNPSSKK